LVEIGPFLEDIIPGLAVDNIRVSVKEISQGSLKEVMWAAIFIAFQKDLEQEVPPLVNEIFGTDIPHRYDTLVTVLFCLLLYYGADYLHRKATKLTETSRIKEQLDGLVEEVSQECHVSKDNIKHVLETRYTKTRINMLARAVIRVFTTSKNQNNSPMIIGDKRIEPRLIAEVPSNIKLLDDEFIATEEFSNVKINLHAQDMDRSRRGWAAVIPDVSPRRLRMDIYPPIRPEDIYTRPSIVGDILLLSRSIDGGRMEPYMFHLIRLRD
jgi:hypothetical protein